MNTSSLLLLIAVGACFAEGFRVNLTQRASQAGTREEVGGALLMQRASQAGTREEVGGALDATLKRKTSPACSSLYSGSQGQREQYLIDAVSSDGLSGVEAAQFMAQCAHECANFNTMEEYASGSAYEGRKDLGNIHPGDGVRYKGRGYIQITGRANYREYGKLVGVDLENSPTRAEEGAIAAKVALAFWKKIVRPRVSNFDDTRAVTRRINGGYNGLADREAKFAQYRSKCGSGSGGGSVLPGGLGACNGVAGTCIDTSKDSCPAGATLAGKCPGSSSIRCCPSSR